MDSMKTLENLPDHARVWIYQANRPLTDQEVEQMNRAGATFIEDWSAHGASLDAAFEVKFNRFIIIAVDEEKALASGCSIDKSVHFMKGLGEAFQVDFFNRMQTIYEEQGELKAVPLHEFWAMRKAGLIGDNTIVFDNLVKNIGEFKSAWKTTFNKSWHAEMWGRS